MLPCIFEVRLLQHAVKIHTEFQRSVSLRFYTFFSFMHEQLHFFVMHRAFPSVSWCYRLQNDLHYLLSAPSTLDMVIIVLYLFLLDKQADILLLLLDIMILAVGVLGLLTFGILSHNRINELTKTIRLH